MGPFYSRSFSLKLQLFMFALWVFRSLKMRKTDMQVTVLLIVQKALTKQVTPLYVDDNLSGTNEAIFIL